MTKVDVGGPEDHPVVDAFLSAQKQSRPCLWFDMLCPELARRLVHLSSLFPNGKVDVGWPEDHPAVDAFLLAQKQSRPCLWFDMLCPELARWLVHLPSIFPSGKASHLHLCRRLVGTLLPLAPQF